MSNQIVQLFESLITRVNKSPKQREFVREWVGSYQGKILQLETDQGTFHIALHKKGTISLHEGAYPSPDVIYRATVDTLMKLFTGQTSFRKLMKRWDLIVIGAGHESVPLGQLVMRVLQTS
jgi:putative sterol carrier protein